MALRTTSFDAARDRFLGRTGERMSRAEQRADRPSLPALPGDVVRSMRGERWARCGTTAVSRRMEREEALRDGIARALAGGRCTVQSLVEATGAGRYDVSAMLRRNPGLFEVAEPARSRPTPRAAVWRLAGGAARAAAAG